MWTLLLTLPAHADCPDAGAGIEVASVNAWGLPFPLAPRRKARLGRVDGWMDGHDVVGLQEIWRGARTMIGSVLFPGGRADSGLGLSTPHPATSPVLETYSRAVGPDRLKKKGFLRSKVELPGGDAWVVVTHLQAGASKRAADVRSSQIDELLATVATLPGPAIVLGDFNLYDDDDVDRRSAERLEAAGLVDAAAATGHTESTHRIGHRLDRVYVRQGCVGDFAVDDADFSDHQPLRATVHLE